MRPDSPSGTLTSTNFQTDCKIITASKKTVHDQYKQHFGYIKSAAATNNIIIYKLSNLGYFNSLSHKVRTLWYVGVAWGTNNSVMARFYCEVWVAVIASHRIPLYRK